MVKSDNAFAMLPLQDVLLLGDEARMNVPGVPDGNWKWQAKQEDIDASREYLRGLAESGNRI